MATIENIPDEILIKIFYYLPVEERMFYHNGVCTRWKRLMPYDDFTECHLEKFHMENCRAGSWCNLKAARRDKQLVKIWMKSYLSQLLSEFGYFLKSIDLRFLALCYHRLLIDGEIMQIISEHCPRLTELNLHNCDLNKEALIRLAKLDRLRRLSIIDDWKFEAINLHNYLPNLTHYDSRMSRPFGQVTARPENLLSVRTDIGSNFFLNLNLFCAKYANLRELYIKNCRWVSPENFSLLGRLTTLRVLHLDLQDDLLNNEQIEDICSGCSATLEDMSIGFALENGGNNNLNLAPLKRLTNLKRFRYANEYINASQLKTMSDLSNLRTLDVYCSEFLEIDEFLRSIEDDTEKIWPNLTEFSAYSHGDILNTAFVQSSFIKYSKFFEILGISAFASNSNVQIDVLIEQLNAFKLSRLAELHIYVVSRNEITHFFNSVFGKLKILKIFGACTLDVDSVELLSESCPNLRDLELTDNVSVTTDVCASILANCQNLTNLKISSINISLQLPSEKLMRILGEHEKLRYFDYVKLLPAYHVHHFQEIVDGRRRLNERGLLTNPLYIECAGTFYLPICILNDLKTFNVCFTNACLISAKFQTDFYV